MVFLIDFWHYSNHSADVSVIITYFYKRHFQKIFTVYSSFILFPRRLWTITSHQLPPSFPLLKTKSQLFGHLPHIYQVMKPYKYTFSLSIFIFSLRNLISQFLSEKPFSPVFRNTTRKFAFSDRFRDLYYLVTVVTKFSHQQKISKLKTDLETEI